MSLISFIVPAHNEERWIGPCLDSIHRAMVSIGRSYEVILVDDASTDATNRLAREGGAEVIAVRRRKISAVRNAGAAVAMGEALFFVDADTQVNAEAVSAGMTALRCGAVGGGCVPCLAGQVPIWGRIIHRVACRAGRILRLVGGCFLFCTRDAYRSVGGFPERLYAGEDIAFVGALKRIGRFVVPGPTVLTSARKLAVAGPRDVVELLARIALRGPEYDNPWVRDLLYGERARDSRKTTDKWNDPSGFHGDQK